MKNFIKVLVCIVAVVSLQAAAFAQTGYSITDRNRDVTGLEQLFYSFDINTGNATLIGGLGSTANEYEGFASLGSALYGVSEGDNNFPSDVRIFGPNRPQGLIVGVTGITTATGNEVGSAYNFLDGFIYSISSNDAFPATGVRSTLFRISPSTGVATLVGSITRTTAGGAIGDAFPYLDGLAILPNGAAFASDCRFSDLDADATTGNGGLYSLSLATGVATFRGAFVGASTIQCRQGQANQRDTGLANVGNQLYLLLEDGRIYQVSPGANNATQVTAVSFLSQINDAGTAIGGDFEAFDIPQPVGAR